MLLVLCLLGQPHCACDSGAALCAVSAQIVVVGCETTIDWVDSVSLYLTAAGAF